MSKGNNDKKLVNEESEQEKEELHQEQQRLKRYGENLTPSIIHNDGSVLN
jgi:hypothetical protein